MDVAVVVCLQNKLDLDVAASGDLLALDALHRRLLLVIFVGFLGAPLGFGLAGSTRLGLGLPLPLEVEVVAIGGGELRLPLDRLAPAACLLLGHPTSNCGPRGGGDIGVLVAGRMRPPGEPAVRAERVAS